MTKLITQLTRKTTLLILLFLMLFGFLRSQTIDSLRQTINHVLEGKKATVGISIKGVNPKDTISINGSRHLPMQSIFKLHLALAVLHQVDRGELCLDDEILIDKELVELYKHLWSPLRRKYTNGANVTLSEILKYTVSLSDNLGCDLLFKLVGGTEKVQTYLQNIGVKDIAIVYSEIVMQSKWEYQYENWTTTNASNQILQLFFENSNNLLSSDSYNFLLQVLKDTKTGKKSIRGLLPDRTIVAHKTGYSGKNSEGMTGALNDIGIVFLPDNSYFYFSIMVSNSMEDYETNQKIIAEIAKLTWDYFNKSAVR